MRVLAVGAHPDDLELLCGGTLAKYADQGSKVTMAHLCSGNMGGLNIDPRELAQTRDAEAKAAAELIKAQALGPIAGDLDLYPEYTGTGLMNILKREVISDPDKVYETVRREFEERYDLMWLKPFGFNNTFTLTMQREHAGELGIATVSDLAEYINKQQGETQT